MKTPVSLSFIKGEIQWWARLSGGTRAAQGAAEPRGGSRGTCYSPRVQTKGHKAEHRGTHILARNMDEESSEMGRNDGTHRLGEVRKDPRILKILEIGLEGEPGPHMSLENGNTNISGSVRPQENTRPNGEESFRRHLDFGQESSSKSMRCMDLLVTLNNFDKDFSRDTIAKLLENVMCKENLRHNRCTKKRQTFRLPKRIREIRKAFNSERQEAVVIEKETTKAIQMEVGKLTREQSEALEVQM